MEKLRISLTDIPERGIELHEQVHLKDIQPQGADDLPVESVTVQGTLTPVSDDFLFQGHIRGTFTHPCDRCLQPAHHEADLDVLWTFQEEGAPLFSPDDEDLVESEFEEGAGDVVEQEHAYKGDMIDLAPLVWEELVLAAPTKFVCREDCKGLCPQCGENLNETTCACGQDAAGAESHPAFAKLRDLFPDLPKT